VTVGGTSYTFATAITGQSAANTVLIGSSVQQTLANLAGAINASSTDGQAAGTTYSAASVANASVAATGTTATSISLQAINGGAGGNALATSSQWAAGTFGGADLAGGANAVTASSTFAVPAGTLPNAGDTVDVGGTTYTFAAAINGASPANTVLIGPDVTSTLANLAGAIDASSTNGQAAGTTYSTGTTANSTVTATNPTATTVTFQAAQAGAGGNAINASTSWVGGVNLSGGAVGQAASATLTVPVSGLPNAGDTVDVGGTTYTFASAIDGASPANTILIGPDVSTTLSNLMGAINATPADSGVNYSSTTVANGSVTATGSTATSISVQANQTGVGGNALSINSTWNGGSLAAGTLAGGADVTTAAGTLNIGIPLPTAGQTVTVGGTTYTFAATINGASPANTVLIGGDVASSLSNLADAINATPSGAGSTFSTGTVANASATATGSTATTLNLQAIQIGTAGNNSIATTTDWTGGAFGGADLAGGIDAATATGAYSVPISLPTAGQTVTVGATTYTFVGSAAGLTAANDVLIGADVQSTLANLAGAINASTANGQGAGITYGTGTGPNTAVTATGSTATTLSLQALTSGSVGDSTATSTTWTAGSFGSTDLTGGADAGTYSDSITVFDSLGNSHVLNFNFTKSASGDWNYQITIPAADVGATGSPQVVASGSLQFDPSGTLISPSTNVAGKITNLADGAGTLGFNWTLFNANGAPVITQTAETSTTSAKNQNGYSSGTLESYTIESSGIIQGVLSNDQTVSLGQIALATFPNYDGLTKIGSNDYQASLASGAATVGAPGSGGRGTLEGGALEASNVDIATAFTELIQAERGYEANAKAITTADNVMQASIALIQG
jgi:flagellar hook-basal body protein